MPFSLPYPGGSTTSLQVCSNGFVSTSSNGTAWNPSVTDLLTDATRWCPMWHDLSPNQGGSGDVHYNANSSRVVITWNGVEYYNSNSTATFQIQFWANGDVHCIYQSVASGGNDYLVGFSLGNGAADPGTRAMVPRLVDEAVGLGHELIKPSARIINCARGGLIDDDDSDSDDDTNSEDDDIG